MIYLPAYLIGQAVVADIEQNVDIVTADRFVDGAFNLTGAETWRLGVNNVRSALVSLKCKGVHNRIQ